MCGRSWMTSRKSLSTRSWRDGSVQNREGDVGAGPTDGRRTGLRPVRVGLFGQFGSGNIGNDASLEAALRFLAAAHPDAAVDVMCGGPQDVQRSVSRVRDTIAVVCGSGIWNRGQRPQGAGKGG